MTFQPLCQPLRQATRRLHSVQAFDGGCLVLSGTVGPHRFNTHNQLLTCISEITSLPLKRQKNFCAGVQAFTVLLVLSDVGVKGCTTVTSLSDS